MIINLQRDQLHVDNLVTPTNFPAAVVKGASINVSGDPTVYQDVASAYAVGGSVTVAAGSWTGIGCYIQQPTLDSIPYRVKAYAGENQKEKYVFIGVGSLAPTGTGDTVNRVIAFPFRTHFDDCILYKVLDPQDAVYPNPVVIGVAFGEATTAQQDCFISVQRLGVAPPQYASIVS